MTAAGALASRVASSLPVAVGMATRYDLDAAREISVEVGRPVMLIASRRQIEAEDLGGGYVGWDTRTWASAARAEGNPLILARDHGGPYQHPADFADGVTEREVTARAVESFQTDIRCGVELLHVDTSLGPFGSQPTEVARQRAVELVSECVEYAASLGRHVAFELGFEVQHETIASADDYRCRVSPLMTDLCRRPYVETAFVVAHTGTKVIDGGNIGVLNRDSAGVAETKQLGRLAGLVRSLGCRLKAHNSDYLSRRAITMLLGHSVWMNISPELGSAQTRAVLTAAHDASAHGAADDFCAAAIKRGYWRKWVTAPEACTDAAKVELGGSYLFATDAFEELRDRLDFARGAGYTRRISIDAAKAVIRRFC
jgi:hypothetical protein